MTNKMSSAYNEGENGQFRSTQVWSIDVGRRKQEYKATASSNITSVSPLALISSTLTIKSSAYPALSPLMYGTGAARASSTKRALIKASADTKAVSNTRGISYPFLACECILAQTKPERKIRSSEWR